ncbi:HEPN domain-containing protein [Natronospora cellulosivora (SeqCode)]
MKNKETIEISKSWLKKAKEDLITSETLLDSPKERLEFLTASIGFHSQQCVEKCLKAILTFNQSDFKRSHDIHYLLNLCEGQIVSETSREIRENADMLNDFAVNARYPGDYEDFDISESKEAFQIAKNVYNIVVGIID